jgi:phosphoserine aminotransferase
MSKPKIYFGAGPAALPREVLAEAAAAVIEYNNTGLSILELPHRGPHFAAIIEESTALVKKLCGLGDDYDVLWLQGGGRHQFAMVPMNFLGPRQAAGYIDSGHWSAAALDAAKFYGNVSVLASSRAEKYKRLPNWPLAVADDLAYVHFTTNNTIYGTQWPTIPDCPVPLIADMSSDLFSMQRDYAKCALFYAVAQKNIGPAGATLVVVRKDLLDRIVRPLPDALSYRAQAAAKSLLNTAPVFAIYTSLLTLRWIDQKGLATIEAENKQKAALLYQAIEQHPGFYTVADAGSRSRMNAVFRSTSEVINQAFLKACKEAGIEGIEGHRSIGGYRVSMYNAISLTDVKALVSVMNSLDA